jgi:dihydrofolate reductase
MAKLIYAANVSLDGYIEDERGNIEWTISDDEVFAFWTDFERPIGTYLYGRRMYESMVYWETASARTRIEREFDPDAIRRLKESSGADITIGGPSLLGRR